jgi:hypothetical protein
MLKLISIDLKTNRYCGAKGAPQTLFFALAGESEMAQRYKKIPTNYRSRWPTVLSTALTDNFSANINSGQIDDYPRLPS